MPDFDPIKADFERDGFAVVPHVFSPDTAAALRARAWALAEALAREAPLSVFSTRDRQVRDRWFLDSGDQVRCFFEEEALDGAGGLNRPAAVAVNKIGHALHRLDPVFAPFFADPALAALAGALGSPDPRPVQSMIIFKPPRIGGEVGWHQDATFLRAPPEPVLGLWIALEDADAGNGALQVLPGGHREPLRALYERRGDQASLRVLDPAPFDRRGAVTLEVPAGSVVALHGHLPHASAANRSDRARVAATLHLVSAQATWAEDNWLRR